MLSMAQLLAQESDLVQQFIDNLGAEQEALKQGEALRLGAIHARKSELIERLNDADKERNTLLGQTGHAGDQEGMRSWLTRNDKDHLVAEEWSKLMQLAREARELNNLNGQLITLRLQATHQALAALTYQPQRPTLYGRDGHSTQRTGSRIIDAA